MAMQCVCLVFALLFFTSAAERASRAKRQTACENPPSPEHGKYDCTADLFYNTCTGSCDAGYEFNTKQTSIQHICDMFAGSWYDGPELPPCVPVCSQACENGGVCSAPDHCNCPEGFSGPQCQDHAAVTPTGNPVHLATGGAQCSIWGQEHYRTFDNKIYTFVGKCEYLLAHDCSLNTFSLNVINDKTCTGSAPCKREMDLYLGTLKIMLRQAASGGAQVTYDGSAMAEGTSRNGTSFTKIGNFYTLQNPIVGLIIKWDGKEAIYVRVTDDLRGKTCGLCGVYDGNPNNDFTISDSSRSVVTSAEAFGLSWKQNSIGGAPCPDSAQAPTCDGAASQRADTQCSQLVNDPAFKPCHSAVDPKMFLESCKFDCCARDNQDCSCKAMEVYARACLDAGIKLSWRKQDRCPGQCSGNKVFQECGSPCLMTCKNPNQICVENTCVEGCFCPQGTVEHNGQCITLDKCPCWKGTQQYSPGEKFPHECNTCVCQNAKINCTTKKCEAQCSATGDPHYLTFDGVRYNYMGNCSYYLVYDKDFDIIVDNIQCGTGTEPATCTKSLTIDIAGQKILLDHEHLVFINGKQITHLPYEMPGITIHMVSSLFMQVDLPNGMSVLWDGHSRVYVNAPPSLMGRTLGMCGFYDGRTDNDFKTREGNVETNENAFGNHWKTDQSCGDLPTTIQPHPCEANPDRKASAEQYCQKLKSDVFAACHDVENVDGYYSACLYDMCSCAQNIRDCICPTYGVYADTCAGKAVKIDWRNQIPECMVKCPSGQVYQVCGDPCQRTCRNLARETCNSACVEGCNCPSGQAFDDNNQCVSVVECPCLFDGRQYPANFTTVKGNEMCICMSAQWSCFELTTDIIPPDLTTLCPANSVYSECASNCPRTCDNMSDKAATCDSTVCKAGCECVPGFVLEGNKCISMSDCPCRHGGKDYLEGDVISMDCNACTCRSRKWVCETKDCPSICSFVGASHYTTFDSREYQFQGECEYVLVKSLDSGAHPFVITTENVVCGTSGVTCSKLIKITVGQPGASSYYTLELVPGQAVKADPGSPFTVHEVGSFIFIDTPFGLSLQWDKGTRVYVRLTPDLKGQVQGLCGNFNGNQQDDFKGPQGGPALVSATEFGDSWRLHDYCGKSVEVSDACERVPARKIWAQQQCGILASEVFALCHPVVDHSKYMERCVFDACACNQGGDCDCLCTAVAAYAHACAISGNPVKWRSKEFCPMECEDCTTYNPCVSPCPKKTCSNRVTYDNDTKECQSFKNLCFEGCDLPPCPRGQVYASLIKPVICIPEPLCDTPACTINGRTYREGERIYDENACNNDCEICNCRNGQIEHVSFAYCKPMISPSQGPGAVPASTPGAIPGVNNRPNQPDIKGTVSCEAHETLEQCTYMCEDLCDYFGRSSGCDGTAAVECVPGCRNATGHTTTCADGEKKMDAKTCVPATMCTCLKPDGTMARPFETWKNPTDSCSDCSCHSGTSLCTVHDPTCTSVPLPTPGTNSGPLCGWSDWLNEDKPTSGNGDFESPTTLRFSHVLCLVPAQIECRNAIDKKPVSAGSGVSCNLETGLSCNNPDYGGLCPDFEVRFYCPCQSSGPTVQTPNGGSTASPGQCVSQWSSFINRDNPTSGDGDSERMTLEELSQFCPGGRIANIDCTTVAGIEYYSSGESLTCTIDKGLVCNNADNYPITCSDYQVRYQCNCSPLTKSHDELPVPKSSQEASKCGWTRWMSGHAPNQVGEHESLMALRNSFEFCPTEDITAIECRPVNGAGLRTVNATCDMRFDGYACRHLDLPSGQSCQDYEVRFLCEPRHLDCAGSSTPQPVSLPKVPIPPKSNIPVVCTEAMGLNNGQIRDDMLSASSFRDVSHAPSRSRLGGSGSWMPARDDSHQYLQIDLLTPHYVTGVTTQGQAATPNFVTGYRVLYSLDGVNWNVYQEQKGNDVVFIGNPDSGTAVTNLFLHPIKTRYVRINPVTWAGRIAVRLELHGCFEAYPPGSTSSPKTVEQPIPSNRVLDECIKWHAWVDTHQPGLDSRDEFEPIATVLAESRSCHDPLAIQCRTATADHTMSDATGQNVQCNLWQGLVCSAAEVKEPSCFNYQVRLGCLKQTTECLAKVPPTGQTQPHPALVIPCYPGMNTTFCPTNCSLGYYCDGAKCVVRSECPCSVDGKVVRARGLLVNQYCETCQCLNGESRCVPQVCTSCPQGSPKRNPETCSCECVTCEASEFQCSTGQCISSASRCDGVIDCSDDELYCSSIPKFIPPSERPTVAPSVDTPVVPLENNHNPSQENVKTTLAPQGCPRRCPIQHAPLCPEGVRAVEIVDDCNCTRKACLTKPVPMPSLAPVKVCRYQYTGQPETKYEIGNTWSPDVCSDCACVLGSDGSAEVNCHKQQCTPCSKGERKVEVPGTCCGVCELAGCLHNGKLYKLGERMPSSRGCYARSCQLDSEHSTFVAQETEVKCPPLHQLPICQNNDEIYDDQGCCLVCAPNTLVNNNTDTSTCSPCSAQAVYKTPQESVSHFRVHHPNSNALCRNIHPVLDLIECAGPCDSRASYKGVMNEFSSTCSCCLPSSTHTSHVTLECDDGSKLEHSYQVAAACSCGSCAAQSLK